MDAGQAPAAAVAGADDDDEECAICFESLGSLGGPVRVPCSCRVAYCHKCWDRALAASMSANGRALCPSCRSPMHVDLDTKQGRLKFSRAPVSGECGTPLEDDWRSRLYQQAKPMQIQLLQRYGAQHGPPEDTLIMGEAADAAAAGVGSSLGDGAPAPSTVARDGGDQEAPRCVCGHRLQRVSARERVESFIAEMTQVQQPLEVIERLMQHPPIVCDLCGQRVRRGTQLWTCENGRRTVLHAVAYDVCESCFMLHAHGLEEDTGTPTASAGNDDAAGAALGGNGADEAGGG